MTPLEKLGSSNVARLGVGSVMAGEGYARPAAALQMAGMVWIATRHAVAIKTICMELKMDFIRNLDVLP